MSCSSLYELKHLKVRIHDDDFNINSELREALLWCVASLETFEIGYCSCSKQRKLKDHNFVELLRLLFGFRNFVVQYLVSQVNGRMTSHVNGKLLIFHIIYAWYELVVVKFGKLSMAILKIWYVVILQGFWSWYFIQLEEPN